jgi:hypothetical protein
MSTYGMAWHGSKLTGLFWLGLAKWANLIQHYYKKINHDLSKTLSEAGMENNHLN